MLVLVLIENISLKFLSFNSIWVSVRSGDKKVVQYANFSLIDKNNLKKICDSDLIYRQHICLSLCMCVCVWKFVYGFQVS